MDVDLKQIDSKMSFFGNNKELHLRICCETTNQVQFHRKALFLWTWGGAFVTETHSIGGN